MHTRRLTWILALVALAAPRSAAAERPNILWITAEDMSPHLGCYGDAHATTPHVDALAEESVRYTRAFATAPVCSPARSCLITGVYATSLGTQHLRSRFPIPERFKGFPAYLREAGYYTSNNVKTDYNCANEEALIASSWDESSSQAHWRKRGGGQPFFSVFNLMTTHQSRTSVWSFEEFETQVGSRLAAGERHDPARVPIPPYYPDTPLVRKTLARYHDCITAMDREVGDILAQLEKDGLAGDTIVFFYSDHGMGLPRGKRVLHDSGMHVPLLVRFPEKFRKLAPAGPGETTERLVSFVDFAPTVLSLAGLEVPAHMQGRAFLGSAATAPKDPRRYVYGARDRVDEAFDLARSVREGRYLYIRNFMPQLSWMQPEGFSDQSPMRRELVRLAREGDLNAAQLTYAAARRPREELYDTERDPHQLENLAGRTGHRETRERMRAALERWIVETRDLAFLPETDVWKRSAGSTPWELARDPERYPLERILRAAELVGRADAIDRQLELVEDDDSAVRYWAVVGLRAAESKDTRVIEALREALDDASAPVRIEAAAGLLDAGGTEDRAPALEVLTAELHAPRLDDVLRAARALELAGEKARPALPAMRRTLDAVKARDESEDPLLMFVRFSLEAALGG